MCISPRSRCWLTLVAILCVVSWGTGSSRCPLLAKDNAAGAARPAGRSGADKVSQWFDFERRDFQVAGRAALLVVPSKPAEGQPWIWRTEFFGHEPQGDLALLQRGFHVAYLDVQNLYGAPVALDAMDQFYEHLTTERGLAKKTVLEGFSRGGLFALNWGIRHPDRVACIYNDAPVCDFRSWPGGREKGAAFKGPGSRADWERCLKAYGLTEAEALAGQFNPIDNLKPMADARVPLLHVCGDADEAVPFDENTQLLAARYRQLGGSITVIAKPGVKHHPHSLANPLPIVRFVLAHTLKSVDDGILCEWPQSWQITQRGPEGSASVRLSGWVASLPRAPEPEAGQKPQSGPKLEYGLVPHRLAADSATASVEPASWITLPVEAGTGRFDRPVTMASGWWDIALRTVSNDGEIRSRAVIERVGAGEVFVIAGQSNSTNYGREKQRPQSGMVATFDGVFWREAFDPQPGTQDGSTAGSFIPAFGDALSETLGTPVGVASTGAGATSVRQWLPKGARMKNLPTINAHVREVGPGEWECTGTLFDGLVKRIEALGPAGCRAVLWHQGESDAGQARAGYPAERQISGTQYADFMRVLINASRERTGRAEAGRELPWLTAQATFHSTADARDAEFRDAQAALWKTGLSIEGPDTDALGAEFRDGVHFNARGQQAHGQAWAAKVATWLKSKP